MELMKYTKLFALAAVLALVVGCGGSTQDEVAEDVVAEGVHTSDQAAAEASAAERDAAAEAEALEEQVAAVLPRITTIYFDFDKSNIRSEYYDLLNAHAAYLQANSNAKVVLEGHTDERGTREYNLALGERRANSVQRYLTLQGVPSSQIEVVSYGEERPAVRGQTREAYDQNRRVEFVY